MRKILFPNFLFTKTYYIYVKLILLQFLVFSNEILVHIMNSFIRFDYTIYVKNKELCRKLTDNVNLFNGSKTRLQYEISSIQ